MVVGLHYRLLVMNSIRAFQALDDGNVVKFRGIVVQRLLSDSELDQMRNCGTGERRVFLAAGTPSGSHTPSKWLFSVHWNTSTSVYVLRFMANFPFFIIFTCVFSIWVYFFDWACCDRLQIVTPHVSLIKIVTCFLFENRCLTNLPGTVLRSTIYYPYSAHCTSFRFYCGIRFLLKRHTVYSFTVFQLFIVAFVYYRCRTVVLAALYLHKFIVTLIICGRRRTVPYRQTTFQLV